MSIDPFVDKEADPSAAAGEFSHIFLPYDPRPVMTRPPRTRASRKFVVEVREALGLSDDEADDAADWIADKMERFGASFSQPVFDMDGNGPMCSFCGAIWPLCGHHHLSGVSNDNAED